MSATAPPDVLVAEDAIGRYGQETGPLLPDDIDSSKGEAAGEDQFNFWPFSRLARAHRVEMGLWWRLCWTVGVSQLLRASPAFIDVAMLGHLGTKYLAAAGVAQIWIMVTSMWVAAGSEEVLSTLCR